MVLFTGIIVVYEAKYVPGLLCSYTLLPHWVVIFYVAIILNHAIT